ncbi:hypothetical protein PMAYCL1PPCAC_02824, partial [Pristionchus mayeri]
LFSSLRSHLIVPSLPSITIPSSLPSSSTSSPIFKSAIVLHSTNNTRTILGDEKDIITSIGGTGSSLSHQEETRRSACPSIIFSTFRRCFPRRNSTASARKTRGVPLSSPSSSRIHFGCTRFFTLMGSGVSSSSSPEPDEMLSLSDRLAVLLGHKPLRLADMLKVTRLISEASVEERIALVHSHIVQTILELIGENSNADHKPDSGGRRNRQTRRNSAHATHRGVGYGHGSTRSRWDIERTVEERLAREEHLIWLLNALVAFIVGRDDMESGVILGGIDHIEPLEKEIGQSALIPLMEYHLKNDSVFDVSEHMELYQALLETAAALSLVPSLVPLLVIPYTTGAKSISKHLIPKFKDVMSSYPNLLKGQMGSPDFRMIDFIRKIERYSEIVTSICDEYERANPVEETAPSTRPSTSAKRVSTELALLKNLPDSIDSPAQLAIFYQKALKHLQMQTYRFIGDYGKLAVPFTFKKEARNLNPFSPSMKDRTKRIAKELASMPNALPLNASNGIFVCVDEGRCDIIKVLISGPDDTPYQNGLFEFDVFFPNNYPLSAPKCSFLTTGAGNVRFNPNLYNDGKICLSILGTWEGRPEEKWNPYCSLLQVLISIQGLIFVKEPYFNEPGFEKYQGTEKGEEYSRKYNLQIMHATLTYAIRDQLRNGPDCFKKVIQRHFWLKRHAIIEQAKKWLVEMKRDALDAEKSNKRKDSVSFDTIYTPFAQERTIQSLIQELQNMQCPVDQCE